MACNVFGVPVTNQFVKEQPEYYTYENEITQKQRARVALLKKNADGKDVNARKFVEHLKDQLISEGDDEKNISMCLIYNATGAPVTFVDLYSWSGHLAESPVPSRIENGQWGAFVTVRYRDEAPVKFSVCCSGSKGRIKKFLFDGKGGKKTMGNQDYKARASVVYSGCNADGKERHWVLSWSTNRKSTNQIYTEIGQPGEFKGEKWKLIDQQLSRFVIYHSTRMENGFMFGMIGNETSAVVEGILTLPDTWFD